LAGAGGKTRTASVAAAAVDVVGAVVVPPEVPEGALAPVVCADAEAVDTIAGPTSLLGEGNPAARTVATLALSNVRFSKDSKRALRPGRFRRFAVRVLRFAPRTRRSANH